MGREGRVLHFNPNNAHENAGTFANTVNQGVEDRDHCGRAKLDFIPCRYSQTSFCEIKVAIASVSCEHCRGTGKSGMFYLFSQSASL